MQHAVFFSSFKKPGLKTKNIIKINYLIIELIKMRLLIFLVSLQIWNNFSSINMLLHAELHFLIPGVTFDNQTRLKLKLDSIYFLN